MGGSDGSGSPTILTSNDAGPLGGDPVTGPSFSTAMTEEDGKEQLISALKPTWGVDSSQASRPRPSGVSQRMPALKPIRTVTVPQESSRTSSPTSASSKTSNTSLQANKAPHSGRRSTDSLSYRKSWSTSPFNGSSGIAEEEDTVVPRVGSDGTASMELDDRGVRMQSEPSFMSRWPSLRTLLPSVMVTTPKGSTNAAEAAVARAANLSRQPTMEENQEGGPRMTNVRSVGSRGSPLLMELRELAHSQAAASQCIQETVDGTSRDASSVVRDLVSQVHAHALELDALGPTLKKRATEIVPLIETLGKQVDLLRVQDAHVRLRTAKEHLDTSDMLAAARAREFKHLVAGMTEGLAMQSGPISQLEKHVSSLAQCRERLDSCCQEAASLRSASYSHASLADAVQKATLAVKSSTANLVAIRRNRESAASTRRDARTSVMKSLPAWQEAVAAHKRSVGGLRDTMASTITSAEASQEQMLAHSQLLGEALARASSVGTQTQELSGQVRMVREAMSLSKDIESLRKELTALQERAKEDSKSEQVDVKQLRGEKDTLLQEISQLTLAEHMTLPALSKFSLPRPRFGTRWSFARQWLTVAFFALLVAYGVGRFMPGKKTSTAKKATPRPVAATPASPGAALVAPMRGRHILQHVPVRVRRAPLRS